MVWYPGKNLVGGLQGFGSMVAGRGRNRRDLRGRATGDPGEAPQIGGADAAYGQDREAQLQALGAYQDAAQGKGPSVAAEQQKAARQQNTVDQMAMAATARGGTLGAQQRQVAAMGAANQMGTSQDLAALRAQEIAAARAGQAGMANTMAGMSGAQVGQNMGMQGQWGMGQRGMDLQALEGKRGFGLGIADRAIGAGMGLGQLAMFSDENLKADIRPAEDDASNTLASLDAIGYRYKDERHGPTDRETIGVRAQDLQKTPTGRRLVHDVPGEGLAVDIPGSLSLLLAGTSGLEKRLRKVEGRDA